jgi:hypothetical protein
VCSALVSALGTTDDPTPTVRIVFDPQDVTPAQLPIATLTYPSGDMIEFTSVYVNPTTYDIPITNYLYPGFYTLEILLTDADGNEKLIIETFEVEQGEQLIWVQSPAVQFPDGSNFANDKQDFAVGTNDFTLTLESITPAVCRIKAYDPLALADNTPEETFLEQSEIFNNDANLETLQHVIDVELGGANVGNKLTPFQEFNHNNLENSDYIVTCKQTGVGGFVSYFSQILYIGVDTSAPDFTVIFTPPIITDPTGIPSTNITIESTNDLLVCTYDHTSNPNSYQENPIRQFPDFAAVDTLLNYSQTFSGIINFPGVQFPQPSSTDFNVTVTCHNPAQAEQVKTETYTVNLDDQLTVDIDYLNPGTSSPQFAITTNIQSSCAVTFNGETTDLPTFTTDHEFELGFLDDGSYSLTTTCQVSEFFAQETITFNLDITPPPQPTILSDALSCGASVLGLEIPPTVEDVQYNITLNLNGEPYISSLQPNAGYTSDSVFYSVQLPDEAAGTATWIVQATDTASLPSPVAQFSTTITAYDPIACDTSYPLVDHELTEVFEGEDVIFDIFVTCEDAQSGCNPNYQYTIVPNPVDGCPEFHSNTYPLGEVFTTQQNGLFCYQATNGAGLSVNGTELLTSEFLINVATPVFGIGNGAPFTLQVAANRPAECYHGPQEDIDDGVALAQQVFDMTLFDVVNSEEPATSIFPLDYPVFTNPESDSAPWKVICLDAGANYKSLDFELGYDTTPAVITAYATPNPVVDTSDMTATFTVETNEATICTYLDLPGENNFIPVGFPGYDSTNPAAYTTLHEVELDFTGIPQQSFTQQISCENIAGAQSFESFTFSLDPQNSLGISFSSPSLVNEETYTVTWTTNLPATCQYQLDGGDILPASNTGSFFHSTTITTPIQDPDENEIAFLAYCDAPSLTTGPSSQGMYITVDPFLPEIDVNLQDPICNGGDLFVSLASDGTGSAIVSRNISVYGLLDTLVVSQNIFEQENYVSFPATPFPELVEAVITVMDAAGNIATVTEAIPSDGDCDSTPPTGYHQLAISDVGYDITIFCEDDESGCAPTYTYSMFTCNEDEAVLQSYATQPVSQTESGQFCYWLYDNSGNYAPQQDFFLQINSHCFNNISDAGELGVNCGPVCGVDCPSCNDGIQNQGETGIDCGFNACGFDCPLCQNGVQDPGENDVDCGGICANSCPGLSGITLLQPQTGISPSTPITIQVSTEEQSLCRHGPQTTGSLANQYANYDDTGVMSDFFTDLHTGTMNPEEYSVFSSTEFDEVPWQVICENELGEYDSYAFTLGYDITDPVVTLVVSDNPIVEETDMTTTLTVTTDDPTLCTYTAPDNSIVPFQPYNVDDVSTFSTTHSVTLSYTEYAGVSHQQNVQCINVAQRQGFASETITVDPQNEAGIVFTSDAIVNSQEHTVTWTTVLAATCEYQIDGSGSEIIPIPGGPSTTHSQTVTKEEGEYNFNVFCYPASGNQAYAFQTITIDSIAPSIDLIPVPLSCTEDLVINYFVDGTGTDITTLEGFVTGENGVVFSTESLAGTEHTFIIDTPLAYETITVTATDAAGNTFTVTEDVVQSGQCDFVPPIGGIYTEGFLGGEDVYVTCSDNENLCTDTFLYSLNDPSLLSFTQENYGTPITLTETTMFYYLVYDEEGNTPGVQSQEIYIPPHCINGVQDADETGQDCGGSECSACACYNNVQDEGEEGIDCGGTCNAICPVNPPGASCFDGIQNGLELGVDCGPTCSNECSEQGPLTMDIITPEFGIGSSDPLVLEVSTSLPATCVQGPASSGSLENQFNELTAFLSTANVFHYTEIALTEVSETGSAWVVICQAEDVYVSEELTLSYDLTPPVLNVYAQPNPVVEPLDLSTTLIVETDDPTVCTYLDEAYLTTGFPGYDPDTFSAYTTQHEIAITYMEAQGFTQQIVCRNTAGLVSSTSYLIEVSPANAIDITFTSPEIVNQQSFTVSWTTALQSECNYRISLDEDLVPAEQTGSYTHEQTITVDEDGEYIFVAVCSAPTEDDSFNSHSITVDTQIPEFDMFITDPVCYEGQISLTLAADGTGTPIVSQTANVYAEQGLLVSTTEIDGFTALLPAQAPGLNLDYVQVVVEDAAGNIATQIASIPTNGQCDFEAPTSTLFSQEIYGGYELFVNCFDNEACAENYLYALTLCEEENAQLQNYNDAYILTETAEFCYWVYDQAGNYAPLQSQSFTVIDQCFNGFEDPDEEGLDCGGVCDLSCDLCSDGIQNGFEEGVDCGGACPVCDDGTNPTEPGGPLDVNLVLPEFGIGDALTFALEVNTSRSAICRQGPQTSGSLAEKYADLEAFSTTQSTTHFTAITTTEYSEFGDADSDSAAWMVVCQSPDAVYGELTFTLGYDVSPPIIDVVAVPNPVVEPESLFSQLYVNTDEPTVCTYLNQSYGTQGFANYNPDTYNAYVVSHQAQLDYFAIPPQTFNQEIVCRNLAGSFASVTYPIEIAPTNELDISFTSASITNEAEHEFTWTTNLAAECRYRTNSEDPFVFVQTTGQTEHAHESNLEDGEVFFEVICERSNGADQSYAFQELIVDTQEPSIDAYVFDTICYDGDLGLNLVSDGTGSAIAQQEVQVYGEEDILLAEETVTGTSTVISLPPGGLDVEYVVILVEDAAGNIATLTEEVPDDGICDITPPTGSLQSQATYGGYDLFVNCVDDEACAETYQYALNSCLVVDAQTENYIDQPYELTESAEFCYWVYDTSNNRAEVQSESFTVIDQCFNGFEDPNEEGLDCGGPCAAQCNTCNNGIQNVYEEGVDCGGVCANSCDGGPNPTEPGGPLEIEIMSPEFGIGTTNPIDLEISTSRTATCRHGSRVSALDNEEAYATLEDFDTSESSFHLTSIDPDDYDNFNNDEFDEAPWTIICLSDDGVYGKLDFTLGYDTTPAIIDVGAFPNPVTDPTDLATVLTVSTDDPTVCTYLDQSFISTGFPNYDPDLLSAYKDTHQVSIEYFAVEPQTFTQSISCRNTAGWVSDTTYTITLDPSNEVDITFTSENITNENTHTVTWFTSRASSCKYRVTSDSNFQDVTETGGSDHSQTLTSDDGLVFFEVFCQVENSEEAGYDFTRVRVDAKNPKLEVYLQDPVCTDDNLVFVAAMDGTGSEIVERFVTVYGELGVVLANESFFSLQHEVSFGPTGLAFVDAEVTASDAAGNSVTIRKAIPSDGICDEQNPESDISVSPAYGGYDIVVSCEDNEDCAPSYVYSQVQCVELKTQLTTYGAQPISQTQEGDFCYWIYDQSGNIEGLQSEPIDEIENQCFNGIEDPNEEGLDCGGPCDADCNTCSNGIADAYEEGLDCGGVCSATCSEEEYTSVDEVFIEDDTLGFELDNGTFVEIDDTYYDMNGTPIYVDENGDLVFENGDGEILPVVDEGYFDEDGNLGFFDDEGNFIPVGEGYINEDGFFISSEDDEFYGFVEDDDGNFVPIVEEDGQQGIFDENGTFVPTETTTTCESDNDCPADFFCSTRGECQAIRQQEQPPEVIVEEDESSLLGLIFIIVGVLLMGGGVYYIVYSQQQKKLKAQQLQQQAMHDKQRKEQEEVMKQRKEKIDALRKKQAAENETRNKHLSQRKEERKSLLSQFNVEKDSETPVTPEKKETSVTEDDFVHIEELHKDAAKKKQSSAFNDLSSLIETGDITKTDTEDKISSSEVSSKGNMSKESVSKESTAKEAVSKENITQEGTKAAKQPSSADTKLSDSSVTVFSEDDSILEEKEEIVEEKKKPKPKKKPLSVSKDIADLSNLDAVDAAGAKATDTASKKKTKKTSKKSSKKSAKKSTKKSTASAKKGDTND